MAMTIKFNDTAKTTLAYIRAFEEPIYFDNANRRQLRFECDPSVISLDALNTILSDPANLKSLELHNDGEAMDGNPASDPSTSIYDNYTIKIECAMKPVPVGNDAETNAEIRADRICFTLGRKTPTEIEQEVQAAQIAELQAAMAALIAQK